MKSTRQLIVSIVLIGLCSCFRICEAADQPLLPGKIVYQSRDDSVHMIDLATQTRRLLDKNANYADSVVWSPDYTKFASVHNFGGVTYIKTSNGDLIRKTPGMITDWSSDGKKLVGLRSVARDNDRARLFTIDSNGSNLKYLQVPHSIIVPIVGFGPKWSPDGQRIVFPGIVARERSFQAVCLIDKDGKNAKVIWHPEKVIGEDIEWLDNRRIMGKTHQWPRASDILFVIDSETKKIKEYPNIEGYFSFNEGDYCLQTNQIVVEADWGYYATTLQRIFLVTIEGLELVSIVGLTPIIDEEDDVTISSPVWSPTGREVAYIGIGWQGQRAVRREITIIDVTTKKKIRTINLPDEPIQIYWIP